MNLANRLTLMRIVLIPVILVFAMEERIPQHWLYATALFIIASVTDLLDGRIARKRGEVTNFGKFMDPIADKLLTTSVMIVLVAVGRLPSWAVIVVIAREFVISGFRLVVSTESGTVIAASGIAKLKTVLQIVLVCVAMVDFPWPVWDEIHAWLYQISLYAAVILTVWSAADYLWVNRGLMKSGT